MWGTEACGAEATGNSSSGEGTEPRSPPGPLLLLRRLSVRWALTLAGRGVRPVSQLSGLTAQSGCSQVACGAPASPLLAKM